MNEGWQENGKKEKERKTERQTTRSTKTHSLTQPRHAYRGRYSIHGNKLNSLQPLTMSTQQNKQQMVRHESKRREEGDGKEIIKINASYSLPTRPLSNLSYLMPEIKGGDDIITGRLVFVGV